MPTFGSLFSGIGGLDLGLERAGWECRWQVEIDSFCRRVLTKHWPDVPKYEDVKVLDGSELEPVDLLAGGFPCQDVSHAGTRVGLDGARSGLWVEFARLVRVVRPRLVLVENVPGLFGRGFGTVLGDLAALGCDAEWGVLSACMFGAPHARERVFIVAHPRRNAGAEGRAPDAGAGDAQPQHCQLAGGRGPLVLVGEPARCVDTWASDAHVDRMAYGIPGRVDRVRAVGNAVVPQVAEWLGRRLLTALEAA